MISRPRSSAPISETCWATGPDEYLHHADFWRGHVHPDDLDEVEAKQDELFRDGEHLAEYRFRKKDGTYCWVSDEQHLIRDQRAAGRSGRLLEQYR